MAVDLGARRVGVAVSDALGMLAHPLCVLKPSNPRQLQHQLRKLVGEQGVTRLVVGLPVNMDGSEGPKAEAARKFAAELEELLQLPVEMMDERLSTRAAQAMMIEGDTRSGRSKVGLPRDKIDQVAAALILESWLTRRRIRQEQEEAL